MCELQYSYSGHSDDRSTPEPEDPMGVKSVVLTIYQHLLLQVRKKKKKNEKNNLQFRALFIVTGFEKLLSSEHVAFILRYIKYYK